MPQASRVDLQSCADEPIHIPGSIQPHGALLFFACHHMAPKQVPYAIRMAADVLSQLIAATIQSIESKLLGNARHHGQPGRPITVTLSADAGQALVEVANAGAPIAPEAVPVLFNPFKRASLANPRDRTGMGLGLYIALQIVREHHGEIAYRHQGGQVIFSLRLPLLSGGA